MSYIQTSISCSSTLHILSSTSYEPPLLRASPQSSQCLHTLLVRLNIRHVPALPQRDLFLPFLSNPGSFPTSRFQPQPLSSQRSCHLSSVVQLADQLAVPPLDPACSPSVLSHKHISLIASQFSSRTTIPHIRTTPKPGKISYPANGFRLLK